MNKVFQRIDVADLATKTSFVIGTIDRDAKKLNKKAPAIFSWNKVGSDAYAALLKDYYDVKNELMKYGDTSDLPSEMRLVFSELIDIWEILLPKLDKIQSAVNKLNRDKRFIWFGGI